MTNALTKQSFMPSQSEMEQLIAVCKTLASCPYYQKLGPGGVLAIWLTAREMNLPPMLCLNGGMYTFSGLVSLSAQLMNMMIINAGHEVDILECTETACEIRITRGDRKHKKDYKPFVYRYTIEHASKAGLLKKDNWRNNPRDMLFNRALSGASRKHTQRGSMGAYAIGEIDGDGEIMDQMPIVDSLPVKEEIKEIKHETPGDWTVFIAKHGLEMQKSLIHGDPDFPATDKMEYVMLTAEKTKMDIKQVITAAIKNEEIFEERFEKWRDEKYKRLSRT